MSMRRAYASNGFGVQSTALTMLSINNDERLLRGLEAEARFWGWHAPSPLPEVFIFADTGDEPAALYPHVEAMRERIEAAGMALAVVGRGESLLEHIEAKWSLHQENHPKRKGVSPPPFFTASPARKAGITRRQCTSWFKIDVIEKEVRRYFNVKRSRKGERGGRCDALVYGWIGISADEQQRMKSAVEEWRKVSHPLVFMNWRRADCEDYLSSIGITAQRSACVYCPFHSADEWRDVRAVDEDWEKVLRLDDLLERCKGSSFMGMKSPLYLNRDLVRMRDYDLSEEKSKQLSLWGNECAGVCGV